MDSIPFEDHKQLLNAAEQRIAELEAENARLREEHVRVTDELLTHRAECLKLLEQCAPPASRRLPIHLRTEITDWLEVMRGKGWTETEKALAGGGDDASA